MRGIVENKKEVLEVHVSTKNLLDRNNKWKTRTTQRCQKLKKGIKDQKYMYVLLLARLCQAQKGQSDDKSKRLAIPRF